MAGKRIDSILVKEAIEKELQFLAGNLDELAAKIKTFPAIRTKTEGAGNVKELSKAQIQYAESLKAVEQLVKQRMASEAKLITLQSDYAVATAKNRTEVQKMNREQKIAAEIALSQEGSIERARAKIKALTLEQSKLNLVTAEGRKRNDEINKSLDKYTEFIRKNVSAAEKQRMNVGNYQGSAKIIVDAMERARQKVQQVERDFGKLGPEARAARGEFEALRQITQDNRFLNIAAKVGDTNKELRFFTQQLNALEDAGMKNSQVYADVRARLAQLTDQIADTKAEVKALSSDTRSFDLFAGSVNFAADALQTYAGTAALFGASEEEVANQIKTLVAVQSVANGVKGIANELTTKGTAANKAYAFVQKQVEIFTSASSTATQKWGAALRTIGIGLVIGLVIKLVDSLDLFESSSKAAEKAAEDLNRQLENQKQLLSELSTSYNNNEKLSNLQLKARGATEKQLYENSRKFKKQELDDLKSLVDQQTNIRLKAESDYNNRVNIIQQEKKIFGKNYTVKFPDGKSLDQSKKEMEMQNQIEIEYKTKLSEKEREIAEFDAEEEVRIYKEREDKKREIAEKAAADKEKNIAEMARIAEANRRAELDIQLTELQLVADWNMQIVEDESKSWDIRLYAAKRYYDARRQMIEETRRYEINTPGKTTKETDLVNTTARDQQLRLDQEVANKRTEISNDLKEKLTQNEGDSFDQINNFISNSFQRFQDAEKARTDKQKEESEKRKAIEEEENKYKKELIGELENFAFTLFEANIERQKNAIQEQINLIEERKNKDIQRINESALSETQKVEKIKIAEAAASAQTERLKQKQKQLDIEKAKFDKVRSIASIIQNTAQGVTAALASIPPNPILAGLIGAIGATQLATVLSTPIPKYAKGKGKDDPYEGPGIAGEAGRELLVRKSGEVQLINKPTLLNLAKGDIIHPNRVTEDMIRAAHHDHLQLMYMFNGGNNVSDNARLEEKTDVLIKEMKLFNSKPPIILAAHPSIDINWVNQHLKY